MLADRSHSFSGSGLTPGGIVSSGLSFSVGVIVGLGAGLSTTWISAAAVLFDILPSIKPSGTPILAHRFITLAEVSAWRLMV